ncbi:UNVERIFIED_CONTAM: hypothetical protein K2H54_021025 [Gekko kuhli]
MTYPATLAPLHPSLFRAPVGTCPHPPCPVQLPQEPQQQPGARQLPHLFQLPRWHQPQPMLGRGSIVIVGAPDVIGVPPAVPPIGYSPDTGADRNIQTQPRNKAWVPSQARLCACNCKRRLMRPVPILNAPRNLYGLNIHS